jgi:hypothetical protein
LNDLAMPALTSERLGERLRLAELSQSDSEALLRSADR